MPIEGRPLLDDLRVSPLYVMAIFATTKAGIKCVCHALVFACASINPKW
jgi:hypothetical protein